MIFWLIACTNTDSEKTTSDTEIADIFVEHLGQPIPILSDNMLASYERGAEVMQHAFTPNTGLGPTFNADSCASCHQMPVAGGSAPRYRDFWLVKSERWDGALVNAGTNGESPVRNLYATAPLFHVPTVEDISLYARRSTPPMFGVGLFAFVEDKTILSMADPEDDNDDGISGRANYEKGEVGRFGYKSQAASLESFNRGAIFNQMGITSNPLFYTFPELDDQAWNYSAFSLINEAKAQVAALDEPTIDDDGIPDPEISNEAQQDLLIFSTYIGVPTPTPLSERTNDSLQGEDIFSDIGCTDCHRPSIPSVIGMLPAYTDLLLHDMGAELGDGIKAGFADANEFRTQPLWGVGLHPPYLHDGRADTLQEAIEWHGGEAQNSRDEWLALSILEQQQILEFLGDLGGVPNAQNFLNDSQYNLPEYGELGGPRQPLSDSEQSQFIRGLELFDGNFLEEDGLNPMFNADSCRACHQDPVIGGAGGIDVNVLRIGLRDENGTYESLNSIILGRVALPTHQPMEYPLENLVIESRQPPSLLGLGDINEISIDSILSNADPEDLNADGISGRPSWLDETTLGRFGWKAQISNLQDFVADALLNEIGITIHPDLSDFTVADDFDTCVDPELPNTELNDLYFYVQELAAPTSTSTSELDNSIFIETGCASCHTPELDGVPLYSDLLLHDMGGNLNELVEQEQNALPTEFRTPPLWGISTTAPFLHDGSAETLESAIRSHAGEGQESANRFTQLSTEEQAELIQFLESL